MRARGIFDLRVWVEGETEAEVYERVAELVRVANLFPPVGTTVKYSQLRRPEPTRVFPATMRPRRSRGTS